MTDPQMPQDSQREISKTIYPKDFKIQDLDWGEAEYEKGDEHIEYKAKYNFKDSVDYSGRSLIISGNKEIVCYKNGDWSISISVNICSEDEAGVLTFDFEIDSSGVVLTNIIKKDPDKKLPRGLGPYLFDKGFSLFKSFVTSDEIDLGKRSFSNQEEYTHGIVRVPTVSDKPLSRDKWYNIFGLYLARHRYNKPETNDAWDRRLHKNSDLDDIGLIDFDWDEGAVYDGDEKDTRVKPLTFREAIKVGDQEAIIQGSSRMYYRVTAEGRELLHELVDLKLIIGEASVILKLKFEGSQVSSEIIPGGSEHQIDQDIIDSFVSKLDHYLIFKAFEDGQDYEYEGNVYRSGEKTEKKLVKEYLESQGVKLSNE